MPELPEVESVRRQLAPRLEGRRIVRVWADPAMGRYHQPEAAAGGRVDVLRRRGKYLIGELDTARDLVLHLGMTGAFRFRGEHGWDGDPYVRATFELDDGAVLDFRDVRRFGTVAVTPAGDHAALPTLARLGPEPLGDAFTAAGLHRALARSSTPVKAQLLSQRPVAGVGNIYADEALWRARIDPRARRVGPQRAARLWAAIREVLAEAIEREGTTFSDYQMVNGESGRNADFLDAYGQAGRPCPRCGEPLRKIVLGGRGTTFCGRCQR